MNDELAILLGIASGAIIGVIAIIIMVIQIEKQNKNAEKKKDD